jgi:hypothetical protein
MSEYANRNLFIPERPIVEQGVERFGSYSHRIIRTILPEVCNIVLIVRSVREFEHHTLMRGLVL